MNTKLIMLMESLRAFVKREDGASAIEYALIAGLMAVIVIGAFAAFGGGLQDVFTAIETKLKGVGTDVGAAK